MSNKCKKCNYITIGKINKYIFLILLESIFIFVKCIIEAESKFIEEDNSHPIIYNISYSLGSSLSFILFIIYNIRNKIKINKTSPLFFRQNNINNINEISWKKKFLWNLLISIIVFISTTLNAIFWINDYNYINTWGFYIIFLSLFSYWLLENKIYKHHYVGIITIVLLGLLYNIITNKFTIDNIKNYYIIYLTNILNVILYSLEYVLDKYCMYVKYIKSYEIVFYQGLCLLVLSIITLIITTKIGSIDIFWDYWEQKDTKEIIIFVSLTLINFIINILFLIIIDIFTPFHIILVDLFPESIFLLLSIDEFDLLPAIFTVIIFIIEVFMILVFIEIIELNFLGLSTMTKKNIELRAQLESMEDDINDVMIKKKIILDEYEIELNDIQKPDEKVISDN